MVHGGEEFNSSLLLVRILLRLRFLGAGAIGCQFCVLGALFRLPGEKSHVFDYFMIYETGFLLIFDAGLAFVFDLVD